jgi:hypothetical protein
VGTCLNETLRYVVLAGVMSRSPTAELFETVTVKVAPSPFSLYVMSTGFGVATNVGGGGGDGEAEVGGGGAGLDGGAAGLGVTTRLGEGLGDAEGDGDGDALGLGVADGMMIGGATRDDTAPSADAVAVGLPAAVGDANTVLTVTTAAVLISSNRSSVSSAAFRARLPVL